MMTSVNTDPLTPEFVRTATFTPARLGRRGLDEAQVHAFCEWVAGDLARVLSENAMLHEEVLRLRDRVLERGGADPGIRPEDGHVQAVYVLSKAQQTADRYVADAQTYSRDIAVEARRRHDDILREAQVRAGMILDEAHASASQAASAVGDTREPLSASERQRLESEIAYLRTFSDVCRTHLRAYMESLTRSIEEWERAERKGAPAAGDPRLQDSRLQTVPQALSGTYAGSSRALTRSHARGRRTGTPRTTRTGSRPTSRSR
jgi:cell division septum initiation protein DivIVA